MLDRLGVWDNKG